MIRKTLFCLINYLLLRSIEKVHVLFPDLQNVHKKIHKNRPIHRRVLLQTFSHENFIYFRGYLLSNIIYFHYSSTKVHIQTDVSTGRSYYQYTPQTFTNVPYHGSRGTCPKLPETWTGSKWTVQNYASDMSFDKKLLRVVRIHFVYLSFLRNITGWTQMRFNNLRWWFKYVERHECILCFNIIRDSPIPFLWSPHLYLYLYPEYHHWNSIFANRKLTNDI